MKYIVLEVVGDKVTAHTDIDFGLSELEVLVKVGDELPIRITDDVVEGGEFLKKAVGDYWGDRIHQSCKLLNTLPNAREWLDSDEKFQYCLDALDMSLTYDGDAVCTAAVNLLEGMFENTLKEYGEWQDTV